jgi:hypothetical protein
MLWLTGPTTGRWKTTGPNKVTFCGRPNRNQQKSLYSRPNRNHKSGGINRLPGLLHNGRANRNHQKGKRRLNMLQPPCPGQDAPWTVSIKKNNAERILGKLKYRQHVDVTNFDGSLARTEIAVYLTEKKLWYPIWRIFSLCYQSSSVKLLGSLGGFNAE